MYLSNAFSLIRVGLATLMILCFFDSFTQSISSAWTYPNHEQNLSEKLSQFPPETMVAHIDLRSLEATSKNRFLSIEVPSPSGELLNFMLHTTKTVSPLVAHEYSLRTFRGYQKDDPLMEIACDISSIGLRAVVLNDNESFIIEPVDDKGNHAIYYRKDVDTPTGHCQVESNITAVKAELPKSRRATPLAKSTFRLALSATGEFSQQTGGMPVDKALVLNALASGLNMVNLIYLRDLGIEFELVTTSAIIFDDPVTDPYDPTNPNTNGILAEAHDVITSTLGSQNFDLGQVISWGVDEANAAVDVLCNDLRKGYGYSSSNTDQNHLWIDQLSHTLAHQFGAGHTFSSQECIKTTLGAHYEPGEGSSIMGYAGKCTPASGYQTSADPYFHLASIREIQENLEIDFGQGNGCAIQDAAGNAMSPQVDAGIDFTIPKETPFILVGEARDDDDGLSYEWSQLDGHGPQVLGSPNCLSDSVALFRFRPPVQEAYRVLPEMAEVLTGNNNNVTWEQLPCANRNITFGLAVRDNNPNWGRVGIDSVEITVTNNGPFLITSPNGGEQLDGQLTNTITWQVNGSDVDCPNVDIHLSVNGGQDFELIADGIPNTGTASVLIPSYNTGFGRLLISCDGPGEFGSASTFFDASDADFSIETNIVVDQDGDGFDVSVDCDDTDPAVFPGATEICNGIDDNCDNLIDEADPLVVGTMDYYPDADGDGYGDSGATPVNACTAPAGHVLDNTDCDDTNSNINPGATEICNSLDDDCDGLIDDNDPDLAGSGLWYPDTDGDGFGLTSGATQSCSPITGFVQQGGDCDDNNAIVNPAAIEICNSIDDDCDGLIDGSDPDLVGTAIWYEDLDGDTFGNPSSSIMGCAQPAGYVANGSDCNDGNASINPNGQEICNGVDDDCDGLIDGNDPSVVGTSVYYADNDGDGYGDPFIPQSSCTQPIGFVANSGDCNDNLTSVNPGATEICNGVDDDCDGLIDSADPDLAGTSTYFLDFDGDGYGNSASSVVDCLQPPGYVTVGGDCNDNDANVNPGANETCNGQDDDCDGLVDDNDPSLVGGMLLYVDNDLDGFGDPNSSLIACSLQIGFVSNSLDCNDQDATISPSNPEICNGIDDDCDGLIDDADPDVVSIGMVWFQDADQDGYGNSAVSVTACSQPAGFVPNDIDCDDTNNLVNPAQGEVCNGIDDDCDGLTDDLDPDVMGGSLWYQDLDGDNYGNPLATSFSCNQPAGYVPNDLDCDDTNAQINPAAQEICNGFDDDCDGLIDDADTNVSGSSTWFADFDSDGFGNSNSVIQACSQPQGYVPNDLDCNDTNFNINPAVGEICDNNIDDDCDGLIDTADPDVGAGSTTWYPDVDGDGFGSVNGSSLQGCNQPVGFVSNNTDCDDGNAQVNPGSPEICDNGIDDDCDGLIDTADPDVASQVNTWYIDADGDGYGDINNPSTTCNQPAGYVSNSSDCDDGNANISPIMTEICDNNIDDDCDGLIDAADPDVVVGIWYGDADGDGFGNLSDQLTSCTQPAGYVSNGTDCNDADSAVNPNAIELCDNGIDDDCDGLIDSADPNVTGAVFWYLDADGDGYGDAQDFSLSCTAPAGYVGNNNDCNDADPSINPDAVELCDNGIDDDCDGLIDSADPDVAAVSTWYLDSDGDGFGDANSSIQSCNPPANYITDNTDCDDTNASVNPEGIEVCNGIDDDCNGLVDIEDDNLSGVGIWFADVDGDGFGDPDNFIFECTQLPGYIPNQEDCNDNDPLINPTVEEVCNGIDDNCDGLVDLEDPSINSTVTTWYIDLDADGFGDPENSVEDCLQPVGFVDNDGDCDDTNPEINPDAFDIPNNDIDEDCSEDTAVDNLADQLGFKIYPNPVRETVTVSIEATGEYALKIITMDGRTVLKRDFSTPSETIEVTSLEDGAYLIKITTGDGQQGIRKMIKL